MKNKCYPLAISGLSILLTSCASTGTGVGELEKAGKVEGPVTFLWKSDVSDHTQGKIYATPPGGTRYSGRYFEITSEAEEKDFSYAWQGWTPYWSDWRWQNEYNEMNWPRFVKVYTGRVIANLQAEPPTNRMRCHFTLSKPREGLGGKGGSIGKCQLSSGETIDNVTLTEN